MSKFATWATMSFVALSVAACQTTAPANSCDGWRKMSPAAQTRSFIIQNDRPFAEQVAGHNQFGRKQGCWK